MTKSQRRYERSQARAPDLFEWKTDFQRRTGRHPDPAEERVKALDINQSSGVPSSLAEAFRKGATNESGAALRPLSKESQLAFQEDLHLQCLLLSSDSLPDCRRILQRIERSRDYWSAIREELTSIQSQGRAFARQWIIDRAILTGK